MTWLLWPKDKPLTSKNYKLKADFCQGCNPYVQGIWGCDSELEAIISTAKQNEDH